MRKKIHITVLCAALATSLVLVAGCQPATQSQDDAPKGEEPVVSVAWEPGMECSSCHAGEVSAMTAPHADAACEQCHVDDATLASAHEGKTSADKMPVRLKSTEVPESACAACHEGYDELAVRTAESTALTDSLGTCVNPHEIHLNGGAEHDGVTCASCHAEHSEKTLEEEARSVCTDCHHQGVYECYTCHE